MAEKPVISRIEAAKLLKDGDTLATATFGLGGLPEDLLVGLKERYEEEQHPKEISIMWSCGIGNNQPGRGADHLLADGLVKRIIAGHVGSSPGMVQAIVDNKYETYLFPQGVFTQWYRAIAGKKPYLTQVGLQTFVDPRLDGAKSTPKTTEELIKVVNIDDRDWLQFPQMDIDVAFIRGTTADVNGNISVEHETCKLEQLELAMATHNSGGVVVAQVKYLAEGKSIDPKSILVPGGLVDYIVVADPEYHYQTMGTFYSPEISNQVRKSVKDAKPVKFSTRKIIARRAAMELKPQSIVNLGIGTPDMVAHVAQEEGVNDEYQVTLEMGIWGGTPTGGLDFGGSYNSDAQIPMANQFDFYDGGGLDLAVLGIGEIDQYGNNNVTKFGPKVPGPGGFINISQNTKDIVFVGTFTIGSKAHVEDGKLVITDQGKGPKFVKQVEQVSFSGKYAAENEQRVLYVTERAVFDLYQGQIRLIELAPGVDLQKDILDLMEFEPLIAEDLKEMNPDIFKEEWGGLKEIIQAKKLQEEEII
ncbi:acyl CoA:acetate/3-ketoacid CoA transferase [Ignavigranum ruoffiae]|uniref:Propionate CoA-transferase n=1 Tax=Ignavigranum ruoffiae TaxID=89093 RepID=A0A1H9ED49_9LACT|nr:CoA-transferase [Ignavigranum ruoffiae]SEQ23686.1 propionate CoA-transferase [Ignavigranum ruoffiae]